MLLSYHGVHTKLTSENIDFTKMDVASRFLNNNSLGSSKKVVMLHGWSFGTSGGGTITKTVNFGMTFKSATVVLVQTLGYKTGSDPTSMTDTGGTAGELARGGMETTTTSTKVFITSPSGGVITSGVRILFSIIVIGEPVD